MSLRSLLALATILTFALALSACQPTQPSSDEAASTGSDDAAPAAEGGAPAVPEGFEDAFADDGEMFVSVYDVADAVDAGMDIQFVDARPPIDVEFGHIPGAINIPYYDAEEADLSALPKDKWLVTYCECPNAEATQLADALKERGYPYVKAIEEGLGPWRDELGRELVTGETGS